MILPGLLWPAPETAPALTGNELPSLLWLLGRAERTACAPAGPAQAFAQALGLPPASAAAALRRAGEADGHLPAPGEHWLCADPVTLRFMRDQLVLDDASAIGLAEAEIDALQTCLKPLFAEVGAFELCHPQRGYLRLKAAPDAQFSPLDDVAGRPVALFLPEGNAALRWGRILNALQIDLHELEFNRQRETEQRPQVNSLWFWGEGKPVPSAETTQTSVLTDSLLGRGAARLAGCTPQPLEDCANLPMNAASTLILDESLHRPALFRDMTAWREALTRCEARLFTPLAQALRDGRIEQLDIEAPRERENGAVFHIKPRRWAFWLRPAAPEILFAKS
ncbi:MAG: hypothetical protein FWD62_11625 [Betaproteobacteria bacterium]|nr:hypothetical protein [Betaproteobacteria bacterium]